MSLLGAAVKTGRSAPINVTSQRPQTFDHDNERRVGQTPLHRPSVYGIIHTRQSLSTVSVPGVCYTALQQIARGREYRTGPPPIRCKRDMSAAPGVGPNGRGL